MPGASKKIRELVALQRYLDDACAASVRDAPVDKYIEELLAKYSDFVEFYLATEDGCRAQYI